MGISYEKCFIMGSGQLAFNCAKYLRDVYRVDCIYEFGCYAQSRLEILCQRSGFPYIKLAEKKECDRLMDDFVNSGKRILIISASNTYIFPQIVTDSANIRAVNYHPALLTKHLGRNAEAWTIYSQDRWGGVTWHEVTAEVDQGAILAERLIELDIDITSIKLMVMQYRVGFELFKEFIGDVISGKDIATAGTIDSFGKMHYSYERPNNGILDLTWDENQISSFLRCMDYGVLNVLGKPFVMEDNLKYGWDSYKILECHPKDVHESESKIIKKGRTVFVLQNIHLLNDI